MSPVVKKKKERFTFKSKYLLLILSFLSCILMLLTYSTSIFDKNFNNVLGVIIIPIEKGISSSGIWINNKKEELSSIRDLINENNELKTQVALLTEQNTLLLQDKYELNNLRELLELDAKYDSYNKIGARIIGKNSGNWYSSFLIDKGSDDGVQIDMNVIADGGLVGRVSSVGSNWARVTAIISDNANVSSKIASSGDNLVVSGDLKLLSEGTIRFSGLSDPDGLILKGDKVVTSNISDKYLPDILIGYIYSLTYDANNITRSGLITPVVDFAHLSEVLVITDMKNLPEEE